LPLTAGRRDRSNAPAKRFETTVRRRQPQILHRLV